MTVISDRPCIGQLIEANRQTHSSVIAVMEIPEEETDATASSTRIRTSAATTRACTRSSVVEKPNPAEAPSNLAIIGRYVLTPRIFEKLEETPGAWWRDSAHRRNCGASE